MSTPGAFAYLLFRGNIIKAEVLEKEPGRDRWIVRWPCKWQYSCYSWSQKKLLRGNYRELTASDPVFWTFREARDAFLKRCAKKLAGLEQRLLHDRAKHDMAVEMTEGELVAKGVVRVVAAGPVNNGGSDA